MKHDPFSLDLPRDSRTKQLEVISKDFFRPLFDVERFVIKEEGLDNGIDFRFEIKLNNRVSGFGFNFQLKSTETLQPNNDGSYSKSLETSNIEYLLNNGQPAFYGFYVDSQKALYYVNLKEVIYDLNRKNSNWQEQENHTVRFTKKLDAESISEIYQIALTEGQMLRRLQSALAESFMHRQSSERIIIDPQANLMTDSDIIEKIEQFGFMLIDEFRWSDVIKLHRMSTSIRDRSARYNLILGVSFYYAGEYFRAIVFFKEAFKQIDSLGEDFKEYLLFFYYGLQRVLNMVSEDEYQQLTGSFSKNSNVYLHRQLEEAISLKSKMDNLSSYVSLAFEEKINELIDNPNASAYIRLIAKIELAFYTSEQFICKLITMLEFGDHDGVNEKFYSINSRFHALLEESRQIGSNFANHIGAIKHCSFIIHYDCIYRRHQKSNLLDEVLLEVLKNIEHAYLFFKTINHVENELFCLSVLLEYYQNLENPEQILKIESTLDTYKNAYGNADFNRKIDFTKNAGTFVSFIVNMVKRIEEDEVLALSLDKEIKEMNAAEKDLSYAFEGDTHTVHLFPLGYFKFPKDKIDVFFQILRISETGFIAHLEHMFDILIPVINCLQIHIEKEGPLSGLLEDRGIESRINMHRIRREMYMNKFPLSRINMG